MNTYVFGVVAAVAVLTQGISASCIRNNVVASPLVLSSPVLSTCAPVVSTSIVSSPIVSAPVVPTTTIVQSNCNSVANSMAEILQMLPICRLLADQLPYCSNVVGLPVASPVFTSPVYSSCTCGYGPIIF